MNKLYLYSLPILLAIFSLFTLWRAFEINQNKYCSLIIQEPDRTTFKILVPNYKVEVIAKELNIKTVNCPGKN
ncbi:hypothetical protein [Pleurocapsa sp. PCC 7319]|uniref:hypothetical protein n=1 Tax=Pleurocapsa sp. PCC 7319 TaxID=118161 RepID=UPI0003490C76|nr:hypothetical protein [Pleurocapsa sp. PCC 7319]